MFGYHKATCDKHWEDISNAAKSSTVTYAANGDDDNDDFYIATPHRPSPASVTPIQIQDDISSIMTIGKDIVRILTVLADLEQEERKFSLRA